MHPSTSGKHLLEECPTPWALAHTSYQNSTHLDPKAIVLLPHKPFWCFVHVHFKVHPRWDKVVVHKNNEEEVGG
jgi:hypothetical protein